MPLDAFLKRGLWPCLAHTAVGGAVALMICLCFAAPAQARPHHSPVAAPKVAKAETDFDCAVKTAYGEARNTSKEEEAVVISLLLERAKKANLSVCRAAHKYFTPRKGSTPGIEAAAHNVLEGDKSLVPEKFKHVTEMRAFRAPAPPASKFRCVGSVDEKPRNGLHGNVFYEPKNVKISSVPQTDLLLPQAEK